MTSPQTLPAAAAPTSARVVDVTDATLAANAPAPLRLGAPVVPARRRVSLVRRLARVLSGLVLAVLALAAVAGAVLVVTMKLSFAPVLSPSMEPTFGPGDLLVTRAVDAAAVEVGDVVILPVPDAPGQRYVHRVIEVGSRDGLPVLRTKGDNNTAADQWALRIDSAQVPSVVTAIPDAGRLALLTQGSTLRIGLIVLVAGLALVATKRALLD